MQLNKQERKLISSGFISGVEYTVDELLETIKASLVNKPESAETVIMAFNNVVARVDGLEDEIDEYNETIKTQGYLDGHYLIITEDDEEVDIEEFTPESLTIEQVVSLLKQRFNI